jgi:hypothetical protein
MVMKKSEILGETKYDVVSLEDYESVPVGNYVILKGLVEGKPEIVNTPSKRPFRVQAVRFYANTLFALDEVKVRYEGLAFIRKGDNVVVWGRKEKDFLYAKQIETDDIIIRLD